jgi:hypothetical protein
MSMTEPQKETAMDFVRNHASKEDILDLVILLEERDSFLRIMELSKELERAPRMLPIIRIWDNKNQILKPSKADKYDEWDDGLSDWLAYDSDISRILAAFREDERVIEVENFDETRYYGPDAFEAINEYIYSITVGDPYWDSIRNP